MINKFSQFLVEEEKSIYFTFGRMNPPTIGHGKLLDALASKAGRSPYRVYVSQSQDKKKNPLQYKDKIKHARKMFPKHARSIVSNKKVKTIIDVLATLYDEGYRNVSVVVGADRLSEFDILLNKYNGKKGRHGFYNFNKIDIVSAGQRDPDAEGAEGASATKQRHAASEDDFVSFAQGLPKAMSNPEAKKLFNDVRKGMGLKEAKEFKNHIQLDPVSDIREAYLRDDIFKTGEEVVMTRNGIVGNIKYLGTNYLIIESKGETWRCWLNDVSKVNPNDIPPKHATADFGATPEDGPYRNMISEERQPDWGTPESVTKAKAMTPGQADEACWDTHKQIGTKKKGNKMVPNCVPKESQDQDIKDRPGSQPKKYHVGLNKAQKISRDRQFKKQANMSDKDPGAYKPAAGDATAKTKTSKHTLKFRKMFGESLATTAAKDKISREKEADKKKHDRMLDRARLKDVKVANMKEYGGPPISRAEYLKQKPMKGPKNG